MAATGPLDGEVPGSGEVGFINHGLIEVVAGEVVEGVGEGGHGEVLAVDGNVRRSACRRVLRRRKRDAGGVARAFRLGHLRLSGAGGEDVSWHGGGAGLDDEVEAVNEEGAKHELDVIRGGFGRDLGADVVAVALEPGGASLYVGCIYAVGGGDEVDHGGLGEEIAVGLDGVAVHEGIGRERGDVDVCDEEGFSGGGALGERLCREKWGGEKREEGEGCSHRENLRVQC